MNTTLSVFYTVLVLGGAQPDVTIIKDVPSSREACQDRVAFWKSEPPQVTDLVSGRPVIMAFYKCVPITAEYELEDIQAAIDQAQ